MLRPGPGRARLLCAQLGRASRPNCEMGIEKMAEFWQVKNQRKTFQGGEESINKSTETVKNESFWKMASTVVHFGCNVTRVCTEGLAETQVFKFPVTVLVVLLA